MATSGPSPHFPPQPSLGAEGDSRRRRSAETPWLARRLPGKSSVLLGRRRSLALPASFGQHRTFLIINTVITLNDLHPCNGKIQLMVHFFMIAPTASFKCVKCCYFSILVLGRRPSLWVLADPDPGPRHRSSGRGHGPRGSRRTRRHPLCLQMEALALAPVRA